MNLFIVIVVAADDANFITVDIACAAVGQKRWNAWRVGGGQVRL